MEIFKKFPLWMQEFHRFQSLKSQFFFYGNIYDFFYFPSNHHQANSEQELRWARFNSLEELLRLYLRNEGYEVICYYDVIDGLRVDSIDAQINKENILEFLKNVNNTQTDPQFQKLDMASIERKPENCLIFMRELVRNTQKLSAGIFNFASRLTANPNSLDEEERRAFLRMLKSAQDASIFPEKDNKRNILIFVCDKLNDIPTWVLLENPLTKGIEIQKPVRIERERFFEVQNSKFFLGENENLDKDVPVKFVDLTDGFYNRDLESLVTISQQQRISLNDVNQIVEQFKYGTRENFWEELDSEKINNAEEELKKRVKGQDEAIRACVEIIKRAKFGLHSIDQAKPKNKPKGVLFFAGPTGVGKTELAKSLAELIFSDEDAVIRFDMSEYNDSNSDVKLIGAPPGYVGYEEGGQLTSKVRSKPYSIILFDEIEKAHPKVFDKFLQILDDGRLTDGKGETVYFSEAVIIFTSNLGTYRLDEFGNRVVNVDIEKDSYEQMSQKIKDEIDNFFCKQLNRPEILNRFGNNIIVFDFIRPDFDRAILLKALNTIKANLLKQKNCRFEFDDDFVEQFRQHYIRGILNMGGRGIINQVETHIKNKMAEFMFEQNKASDFAFRVLIDKAQDNEVVFKCIGD